MLSCVRLFATSWTVQPWNSPCQNTGVGSLSLLQGIFPTQGSNPGLPHCRWIFYQLSHKGSPKILGWVSLSLLQWIFPTQELNQGLLHCRQILYQLSYQGSPGDFSSIPGSGGSPGEGIGYPLQYSWASLVTQSVKNLSAMWESWVLSLGWEDPLEEGLATHSSSMGLFWWLRK